MNPSAPPAPPAPPPRKPGIAAAFLGALVLVAALAAAVMGYFWIAHEHGRFARDSAALRQRFLDDQRRLIRNEVDKVFDYIAYRRSLTEARLQDTLRERVNEARGIALHLHDTYRGTLPQPEIERLVKEALRPIRFNGGRGYFFAVTLDGVEVLYPVAPQYEGHNLLDFQDARGNYVIRDEIRVVSLDGEGFVKDYWTKPGAPEGMVYPKMTFVKRLEPFGWYLGTGEYLDDFERDLKAELLERIADIRFGREGYIFVNTYGGEALITDGRRVTAPRNLWELTDPQGVKVIQAERRAVEQPGGDFIYYTWNKLTQAAPAPKVSFVRGLPDWEWMIGAGVYLDEVEGIVADRRAQLRRDVREQVVRIVAIMLTLVLVIVALAQLFVRRLRRGMAALIDFFRGAATRSIAIDPSRLPFREFSTLAEAANAMLRDRLRAEEETRQIGERLGRSRKMEALGLLTSGVAHDLNNILSGVVSYPELLLLDLPAGSPLRQPLETIRESGMRAAGIVADLLDASRGGQAAGEVLSLNVSVERFLQSLTFQELTRRHPGVRVERRLGEEVAHIRCSPAHLGKALMNLVTNALEAVGGTGRVTVATRNRSLEAPWEGYETIPPGDYAVLAVADTGPGIPAADLGRIFEPFFSRKTLGRSGTGLGLAIVWHTVHDHQGFIDVVSSAAGTEFALYFPACPEALPEPAEPSLAELQGGGERILVVDDEAHQREIACDLLRRLGYRAEAVSTGEAALAWLAARAADLVILDMVLGTGLNGRETCERMLARCPGQKAIIASGFAESGDLRAVQALGVAGRLQKPYTLREMAQAVRQALAAEDRSAPPPPAS